MITKKFYTKTAGYIVSFTFLYLTFKDIELEKVINYLNFTNYLYLIAAAGFNICFFVLRGLYQINNLHYIQKEIPFFESVSAIGMAQFYNVIFPARLGELVRTYFLSKRFRIKKFSLLSYILVEKLMDILLILSLLMLIFFFVLQDNFEIINTIITFSGTLFSMIVLLIIYIRFSRRIMLGLKKLINVRIFGTIHRINEEILIGLKFFKSKNQIAKSLLLLLLSWICIVMVFGLISQPYVVLLNLPIYSCLLFTVFSALSLSVPSAPAGIGVMHYGLFLSVKLLDGEIADSQIDMVAAFTIITHFFVMLFDVLVGAGIMILYNLSTKNRIDISDEHSNRII